MASKSGNSKSNNIVFLNVERPYLDEASSMLGRTARRVRGKGRTADGRSSTTTRWRGYGRIR